VLNALEQQAGIRIDAKGGLVGTLSHDFRNVPIEQALRRLFRDANVLFFYAQDPATATAGARLVAVWLFPKDRGTALVSQPPGVAPARELTIKQTNEEMEETLNRAVQQGDLGTLQGVLLSPGSTIQARAFDFLMARDAPGTIAFLSAMIASRDQRIRHQALFLLSEIGLADASASPESVIRVVP
jgi:hypothetical protein